MWKYDDQGTLTSTRHQKWRFSKKLFVDNPVSIWSAYAYTLQCILLRDLHLWTSSRNEQNWRRSEMRIFSKKSQSKHSPSGPQRSMLSSCLKDFTYLVERCTDKAMCFSGGVEIQTKQQEKSEVLCGDSGLFLYWFHALVIRNISRSPLWSSWSISLLISETFDKEYK